MTRVLRKRAGVRRPGLKSCLVLLFLVARVHAQTFTNLDFESANLSGYSVGSVPASDAIPGWTAYLGGTALTMINYNTSPFSSGYGADILDAGSGHNPHQGVYEFFVQGGSGSYLVNLGQTGTIPVTARSLFFWAGPLPESPSFDGHALSLISLGDGIYGADISAYAGQTGELLFKSDFAPFGGGYFLDDIRFSNLPVPEPGTLGLLALGGMLLGWRLYKTRLSP